MGAVERALQRGMKADLLEGKRGLAFRADNAFTAKPAPKHMAVCIFGEAGQTSGNMRKPLAMDTQGENGEPKQHHTAEKRCHET